MLHFANFQKYLHKKFSHAHGHGGQNINKRNTKVQLELNFRELVKHQVLSPLSAAILTQKHPHGFLEVSCQATRSQHENCLIAAKHLRQILVQEMYHSNNQSPTSNLQNGGRGRI